MNAKLLAMTAGQPHAASIVAADSRDEPHAQPADVSEINGRLDAPVPATTMLRPERQSPAKDGREYSKHLRGRISQIDEQCTHICRSSSSVAVADRASVADGEICRNQRCSEGHSAHQIGVDGVAEALDAATDQRR